MKFGDFFDKEWDCRYGNDPCWNEQDRRQQGVLHRFCGWRWFASINEWDYEHLKDARLVK